MSWEMKAAMAYAKDDESVRKKAIAAGRAIDNALKKEYSKGGWTKQHFMSDNWLKYFSYEALSVGDRLRLFYGV